MDRPKRLTLAQMASQSSSMNAWACPKCGIDLRGEMNSKVDSTRHAVKSGNTVRRRICRGCGQSFVRTEEVAVPSGYKIKIVPEDEEEAA